MRRLANSTLSWLSLAFFLAGCVTSWTGQHVPIDGAESSEQKVALAEKVFVAMPIAQMREQIRQRYPQLSTEELQRIYISYTKVNIVDKEKRSREEVHLTVAIHHNRKLHPIARDIEDFVASLLRDELKRQRAVAQNPTNAADHPSP